MIERAYEFDKIIGHPNINEFLLNHIRNNTLPQRLLIYGPEGLGKTSYADAIALSVVYGLGSSPEKDKAIESVVLGNKSNDSIKKYKMSVEGGKDAAKEVLSEFNVGMTPYQKKVIIMDECHRLSTAAQDVFLVDTEYIPKGLYIIMLTTDMTSLQPTLRRRFYPIPLSPVKLKDMLDILRTEVSRRNLNIQGGDSTLTLIANWAECKPAKGLSILEGFADGMTVASSTIKTFIGYLDIDEVLPIATSLSDSLTLGLNYISGVQISDSILDMLLEMLKIKLGQPSYKLKIDEVRKVRGALVNVPEDSLLKLVYRLASSDTLDRRALISAFIYAHPTYNQVKEPTTNTEKVLKEEIIQKAQEVIPEEVKAEKKAPSFENLIRNARVVSND